jgi:hypothetical protein
MSITCPVVREQARVERARRTIANSMSRIDPPGTVEAWGLRACLQRAIEELEHAEWWLARIATTTTTPVITTTGRPTR